MKEILPEGRDWSRGVSEGSSHWGNRYTQVYTTRAGNSGTGTYQSVRTKDSGIGTRVVYFLQISLVSGSK